MATTRWRDIRASRMTPERDEEVRRNVKAALLEMDLKELRTEAGKTQTEMAPELEMTQSELSKIERRNDHLLSTLRNYVEALGGTLEIVAVLGNKRIALRGV